MGGVMSAPAQQPAAVVAPQGAEHPFISESLYPNWARMTPQQFVEDAELGVQLAEARLAALQKQSPQEATFDNTFRLYHDATAELDRLMQYAYHLYTAHNVNPAFMSAVNAVHPAIMACKAELKQNPRIRALLSHAATAPWVQQLSPAKQRYIAQVMQELRAPRLKPQEQQRLQAMQRELNELLTAYDANVRRATENARVIIRNRAELNGVPPRLLEHLQRAALAQGIGTEAEPAWVIGIKGSAAGEVLRQCGVESTRRRCWEAMQAPGKHNAEAVMRIMQLRCEIARMEGFRNHADKKLHDRMMGSGQKALLFVDEMLQQLRPLYDAREAELLQFASDFCGQPLTALAPWDVEFYRARMAESKARFNTAQLRPYLEQESVLRGMMDIFSELLGLRITELPAECPQPGGVPQQGKVCVWHPQVRVFAVHDATTGAHYGSFYLDLYSRRGKQSISWSQTLSLGTPAEGGGVGQPHLSAMMLNLTPPQEGKPKLLSHMETRVLFHEFGHILHMLLGHGELREQASANQAIDFVELPSHLAEEWAWQPEVLCSFAKHYETGESLPAQLAQQLSQYHRERLEDECLRSLLVAKLDLELHTHYYEKFHGKTLDAATAELLAPWQLPSTVPLPSEFRNLPHCITVGYDACFYSYTFAEVMAEDVFSVFRENGVRNAAAGRGYRRAMLEPGSSLSPAELYRRFMGRPPQTKAFLDKLLQRQ